MRMLREKYAAEDVRKSIYLFSFSPCSSAFHDMFLHIFVCVQDFDFFNRREVKLEKMTAFRMRQRASELLIKRFAKKKVKTSMTWDIYIYISLFKKIYVYMFFIYFLFFTWALQEEKNTVLIMGAAQFRSSYRGHRTSPYKMFQRIIGKRIKARKPINLYVYTTKRDI